MELDKVLLEEEILQKRETITEAAQGLEAGAKHTYFRVILERNRNVTVEEIEDDYEFFGGPGFLQPYLAGKGILLQVPDVGYVPSAEVARKGYTATSLQNNEVHVCWTPAGQMFLYGILLGDGMLPQIEWKE